MSAELAFNRNVDVDYGVAEEVAPQARRIVANNPGPYTSSARTPISSAGGGSRSSTQVRRIGRI